MRVWEKIHKKAGTNNEKFKKNGDGYTTGLRDVRDVYIPTGGTAVDSGCGWQRGQVSRCARVSGREWQNAGTG
jgi:hypothetical protein